MEEIGWIKTWPQRAGNYPVLLCRASVHDLSGNEYRINADATTDWKHPVYEPVGELSDGCPQVVGKVAGLREERVENREWREKKSTAQAPPSLSFSGQHLSVTTKQDALLGEAFPWIDRPAEYRKADSWLEANPERRPKKANRFLHNWFSRISQPNGGSNGKSKKLTGDDLTAANLKAAGFVQ